MKNMVPQGAAALAEIFAANGHVLYLVGGYVRNLTLGLPGGDFDVCSAATPEIASDFLRGEGLNVIDKAAELGTIEVHMKSGMAKNMCLNIPRSGRISTRKAAIIGPIVWCLPTTWKRMRGGGILP